MAVLANTMTCTITAFERRANTSRTIHALQRELWAESLALHFMNGWEWRCSVRVSSGFWRWCNRRWRSSVDLTGQHMTTARERNSVGHLGQKATGRDSVSTSL